MNTKYSVAHLIFAARAPFGRAFHVAPDNIKSPTLMSHAIRHDVLRMRVYVSNRFFHAMVVGAILAQAGAHTQIAMGQFNGLPAITVSGPEEVVQFSSGLMHVPDENISFIKDGGKINLWVVGNTGAIGGTYYFRGDSFDRLTPNLVAAGKPVPVLMASGIGFDRDYAGSGAVMRSADNKSLLMFYHAEDHSCGMANTKASVGLAKSADGGATWQKLGLIIASSELPPDCNFQGFKGSGNPTATISPDGHYIYLYFNEWISGRPDSISLARATIESDGIPGSWLKYRAGSFVEPGLGGKSDTVIGRTNDAAVFAALANVSFNKFLNQYLVVFDSQDGFYSATSVDGIQWQGRGKILDAPSPTQGLPSGANWYAYPTLLSLDQDTDDTTAQTGYLYYAKGVVNVTPHYLVRRPFIITAFANYQGLWWNVPAGSESGWGMNVAHQGDVIFLTWFTYDATGKAWWLSMTATKTAADVYTGTLYQTHGPAFSAVPFNPAAVTLAAVGTGTLTFADGNNGSFAYVVNGIAQTKAITRQVFGPLPTCNFGAQPDLALATNYQDLWWAAPAGVESGWGVNFTHQGDIIFATWFTYDTDGTPLWLSATVNKSAPGIYTGMLYRTTGPAFNAVPFLPANVALAAVGPLTLTFANGNSANFAYTVNGVTQTKSIERQVFRTPGTVCQ